MFCLRDLLLKHWPWAQSGILGSVLWVPSHGDNLTVILLPLFGGGGGVVCLFGGFFVVVFFSEIQNGTFITSFCDVFSLATAASQYLEHTWVVKILLLVLLKNIASVLSKVNKQFRNLIQAPRGYGHRWHGTWENTGRHLENLSPPMVWNCTPNQLRDPDEVVECLGK